MDTTGDEPIEALDPPDDPPKPRPQIETDVEVGGGGVLIPDDDDELKSDETKGGEARIGMPPVAMYYLRREVAKM